MLTEESLDGFTDMEAKVQSYNMPLAELQFSSDKKTIILHRFTG